MYKFINLRFLKYKYIIKPWKDFIDDEIRIAYFLISISSFFIIISLILSVVFTIHTLNQIL